MQIASLCATFVTSSVGQRLVFLCRIFRISLTSGLTFFLGGGGTWNACFSLLRNVYLICCSVLFSSSANCLITFSDFNQIKFYWKKMTKVLHTMFCENPSSGSRAVPCRRTDRYGKANSRQSATLGTRLNKTWVTRAERRPTDCDAPSYVTFVSSFHRFFTVNCKHHLQRISSPNSFLQTSDRKCSFSTNKTRFHTIRQNHNKFQMNWRRQTQLLSVDGADCLSSTTSKQRRSGNGRLAATHDILLTVTNSISAIFRYRELDTFASRQNVTYVNCVSCWAGTIGWLSRATVSITVKTLKV
jgi:hypothetical protein